jgi:hypothetical protein
MTQFKAEWLEHQRRRYMRPDSKLYSRPDPKLYLRRDAHRFLPPQAHEHKDSPDHSREPEMVALAAHKSELLKLKSELDRLLLLRTAIRLEQPRRKAGFNPAQPRVPAGNPDGGEWTSDGDIISGMRPRPHSNEQMRSLHLAADITGFTRHGINQAISRGVSPSAIRDAVVNPLQILPQANGTTRYIGAGAVVVLDPGGKVITVWGR